MMSISAFGNAIFARVIISDDIVPWLDIGR
ncbi:MAG: hypothetical protein ACI9JO_001243 [Psychrobacter okhotskensis]|jgi:hypothetical protein